MNLRTICPDTIPAKARKMHAFIGISKSGVIRINKAAVEKLGLTPKDQIVFHQDESSAQDWYVEKVKQGGFVLAANNGQVPGGYTIQNSYLVNLILDSCNANAGRILIGEPVTIEKKKMVTLITASLNDPNGK